MTESTQSIEPNLDLHAYVDGETTPDQGASVEARLDAEASARVLVKALQVQRHALHGHYPLPSLCPKTAALVAHVLQWPARPAANR
jgi:anti-sigma factor RsiW